MRRMFLLYIQFGFYLLFFFHLNLFRPLFFKFFPTSKHHRTNILFWIQCLGGQFSIHLCFQFPETWSYLPHLLLQVVNTWPCFLLKRHDILLQGHSVRSQSFHHVTKIITGWRPHNIGVCELRGLSFLIILLGLKSMGMELSSLIAWLRLVPIT